MAGTPVRRRATYDDVLAAPPHMTAELVHGELHLQPRPAIRHGRVTKRITRMLGGEDGDDLDGWIIEVEAELHLGRPNPRDLVVVPDLSGWRADRLTDVASAPAIQIVPDWICEVLSPSTARRDRLVKMDLYGSLGVTWAWLVDPEIQLVEVFELQGGIWMRVQAVGPDRPAPLLPFGVLARLDKWFPDAPPTEPG